MMDFPGEAESGETGTGTVADGNLARRDWLAWGAALAGWIVPGLGHALLGRWGRALGFFIAVGGLAVAGCAMRGEMFAPGSAGPFGTLGFLADAAAGVFYFAPHVLGNVAPDLALAAGNYGTRLIAAAGLVNLLGVIDAYAIASGSRI